MELCLAYFKKECEKLYFTSWFLKAAFLNSPSLKFSCLARDIDFYFSSAVFTTACS